MFDLCAMQDVDFGRMYKYRHTKQRPDSFVQPGKFQQKLGVLLLVAFLSYIFGLFSGIQFERYQTQKAVAFGQADEMQVSANINNEDIDPRINISADLSASEEPQNNNEASNDNILENENQNIKDVLKSDQSSYLILARMYKEKARAYYNGSILQKKGLPVFLAESGSKMKVYVGPVRGKNDAYKMLAKVKKVPEFSGAIMYKK